MEHVHRAITNGLRLRNVDVLTVQEDNRTGVSDEVVLARSITLNRVVFTQDYENRISPQKNRK